MLIYFAGNVDVDEEFESAAVIPSPSLGRQRFIENDDNVGESSDSEDPDRKEAYVKFKEGLGLIVKCTTRKLQSKHEVQTRALETENFNQKGHLTALEYDTEALRKVIAQQTETHEQQTETIERQAERIKSLQAEIRKLEVEKATLAIRNGSGNQSTKYDHLFPRIKASLATGKSREPLVLQEKDEEVNRLRAQIESLKQSASQREATTHRPKETEFKQKAMVDGQQNDGPALATTNQTFAVRNAPLPASQPSEIRHENSIFRLIPPGRENAGMYRGNSSREIPYQESYHEERVFLQDLTFHVNGKATWENIEVDGVNFKKYSNNGNVKFVSKFTPKLILELNDRIFMKRIVRTEVDKDDYT